MTHRTNATSKLFLVLKIKVKTKLLPLIRINNKTTGPNFSFTKDKKNPTDVKLEVP